MPRRIMIVTLVCALGALITSCAEAPVMPKNAIIFIGDGMGFNQVEAACLYEHGETGKQIYDQFPVRLGMSTHSATGHGYSGNDAASDFEYVREKPTDSAAAATAMSTGVKTYNGAIGVDMERNPLRQMSDAAKDRGKSVGTVTSVQMSHATPAAFIAHNEARHNYAELGPSIVLDTRADVVMGAGHPLYNDNGEPADTANYKYVGNSGVWDLLAAGGTELDGNSVEDADGDGTPDAWTLVQTKDEFEALTTGETPERVFGVAMVWETLQNRRVGDPKAESPYTDPMIETVPSLETMARAALNVLDNDPDGFFVMIEGGAVDWSSHRNESSRMVEEMINFNRAIAAAVEWVETSSSWDETLLIITADHETGYLTGPGSGNVTQPDGTMEAVYNPLVNNGAGNMPGHDWNSGGHVNTLVPFYAKGAGSDLLLQYADDWDPNRGYYINNTEFAQLVFRLWD